MIIERNENEIIFKLPADMELDGLQKVFDYLRFKELIKDSKATQEQADELASDSKKRWWAENKSRFIPYP